MCDGPLQIQHACRPACRKHRRVSPRP
jgi:hypothetical protein